MSKPAAYSVMAAIHAKLAEYMEKMLDEAMADDDMALPLDAASMGQIKGFLKDNDITSEPQGQDDLAALREKYAKASASGSTTASVLNVIQAAEDDAKEQVH